VYRGLGGIREALLGKSDGTRPLGRPRHKRNYNINMDIEEVE
jgi:hypothetical protein